MIDPAFLDETERFGTSLKRETDAVRQGEQRSPNVGEGLTFSDYRRYVPGDDTRLVDWKLYARTEEYYIKQYEEERSLSAHVLLDASGSMDFGGGVTDDGDTDRTAVGDEYKFEYAAKIGLGFAYLFAQENNDFYFSVFRDSTDRLDAGRSNRGEVLQAVDTVNDIGPRGPGDIETALQEYADRITSRSLVVVVSDFLDDPDAIEAGVSSLAPNDVVLAQTLSPEEHDPDPTGDTIFEDLETNETQRTYFGGSLAEQYRSRLDSHVDRIRDLSLSMGAQHEVLSTGDDFFDSFASVWVG